MFSYFSFLFSLTATVVFFNNLRYGEVRHLIIIFIRIEFFVFVKESFPNSRQHVRPTMRRLRLVRLRATELAIHFVHFICSHTRQVDNRCSSFSNALLHTQLFCSLSNEIYLSYKLKMNQALISM